jgi:hypothetical protein
MKKAEARQEVIKFWIEKSHEALQSVFPWDGSMTWFFNRGSVETIRNLWNFQLKKQKSSSRSLNSLLMQ